MRKILYWLSAAVLMLGISSCGRMLDRTGEYIISFETQGYIVDEEDEQAIKDYFEANFLKEDDYITFTGSYADAVSKALEFFEERRKTVDGPFILSHINDPQDVLYLICVLTGDKTREAVSSVMWNYNLKEELGLVTE